ncbi:MAG TPA: uroporphyrinogen decarboxylase family protein [Bacteroidota bacterium]
MTSKERVLTAFSHNTPDRVPIDYLANPGIDARLKYHFGLHPGDDEALRRLLGVDFFEVPLPYIGRPLHTEIPGRKIDLWGIHTRWVPHDTGGYWDYCDFPLKDADEETVALWPMPSPDDFDYEAALASCRQREDYCLLIGNPGGGDVINTTGMIRTMEQTLVDMCTDEPAGLLFMDRKNAVQLETYARMLEKARGKIDMMWLGEDLGTQQGPMVSLELFRKHIRPRHQKFVDLARAYDIPVMFHSCGSSSWAFDDFIAMGIAVIDTLQPEAKDMAPAFLKQRFGASLAFHGCISTAGPVACGTVEETVHSARRTLDIMMPGGGYAFSPTHLLQDNSPTANVVALYETARTCGRYR